MDCLMKLQNNKIKKVALRATFFMRIGKISLVW